jgi:hypothetical protein
MPAWESEPLRPFDALACPLTTGGFLTPTDSPDRRTAVELFNFFRLMLALAVTVTVCWPVNIPFLALAYRVRQGQVPMTLEPRALWLRSTFAALGLAVLGLVLVVIDSWLINGLGFPAGPIHLVLIMVYLPVAVWFLFVMFAYDDLLPALGLLMLYLFLPGLPLLFVHQVLDVWSPLEPALGWLPKPS